MRYNVKQPGWLFTLFGLFFDKKELTEICTSAIKLGNIVA